MDTTLMEEESSCQSGCGCYFELHITGKYRVGVKTGDEWDVWEWSYCDSADEVKKIDTEIKAAIALISRENLESPQVEDSLV